MQATQQAGRQVPSQVPPSRHVATSTQPAASKQAPGVQSWAGADILAHCQSPELVDVYHRWIAVAGIRMPRLSDMIGLSRSTSSDIATLLLRLPNDFLFLSQGAGAVQMTGRNYTGMLLSDMRGPLVREIETLYVSCLANPRPIYLRYVSQYSEQHFNLEQVCVPLALDDGHKPSLIQLYTAARNDESEILRAIFDHSPVGMIAALPSRAEGAKPDDGRIMLINAHARRILKLPDAIQRITTVRDLGPWFRDGALWTRTSTVSEGRQTHIHYRDRASGMSYRMTIEPISRFMLFSITEVLDY